MTQRRSIDMFLKLRTEIKEVLRLSDRKSNLKFWLFLGLFLELFIAILGRGSLISTLVYIVSSPLIFLFNLAIVLAVLSLAFLTKRRGFAFVFISIIWLAIGITNGVLLTFRTTPFTAQDLRLIKDALSVANDYLGVLGIILIIAGVVLAVLLVVIAFIKAPVFTEKIPRFKTLGFIIAEFGIILIFNELGTFTGFLPTTYGNIADAYDEYGVVYCFANTLLNTGIKEPDDYDETLVDDEVIDEAIKTAVEPTVEASSNDEVEEESSLPNIIVVQLESFFDVTEMDGIQFTTDPIPFFHSLCEDYTSGYLSMPSVGAGTANSEFEVITGMDIDYFGLGEYPYKTILQNSTCESIAYNLEESGYVSYAIHNNDGSFYDRNIVYPKLGFSCFVPMEYMYDLTYTETGWAEDKCLTTYIEKIISDEDDSAFIYTVSVQGHGSYPDEEIIENPLVDILSMPEGKEDMYEQYLYYVNQLYEMDMFLDELVEALENSGEECVLVLFGDHLPSLDITEEELLSGDLYLTKYVVWDNIGLEEVDEDLQAYQLMASVCDKIDIHNGILCSYHQMYLNGEIEEEEYLEKLESLEYDMLYGDQLVYDGENPYEEKDMTFGVYEISISEITYKNGYLYVAGENFNEYSTVIVDEKQLDTIYISSHLLVAEMNGDPPEEIYVSVGQVGDDHYVLGETEQKIYVYVKEPDVPDAGVYE